MKLIDGKSVLLGMGIGIIITAILAMIFFSGVEPKLSDAEIIQRARELGMTDKYVERDDIRRNPDGSLIFVVYENDDFTSVSKRLYDEGIIESSIEFDIIIKKEKLENAIKPGSYNISYSDNTKTIIQKLTQQ
ncbi:MAG: endolytic transglycosylase MltG [Clostridiaceae bacterium]|nr:endolytic transglycosylase MltG [Clostridiaceae bacterium]